MVIYADVLVALNIFINYLILLCAARLSLLKTSRTRLVAASVFGGICSLVILLPEMGAALNILIKTAVTGVITVIAFSFSGIKGFFKALLSLIAVNAAFAGLSLAVYYLFPPKNMLYLNGTVYFDIDIKFFITVSVASFLFIKLVFFLLKRYASPERLIKLTVGINGKSAVFTALVDTGNSLCDAFTGKAVTVAEYSVFRGIIPPDFLSDTYSGDFSARRSVVPYKTASGSGFLFTVRADEMIIEGECGRRIIASPIIALTKETLSDGQFQALVNERIFHEEVKTDEKTVKKTK